MNPGAELLTLSLVGGLLALDRTAFLQAMVSRPVVAGPIVGLIVGDAHAGLICGALVELLWLMKLPVGGSIPPDETLVAIVATFLAAGAPQAWGWQAGVGFGVALAIPFGRVGQWLDVRMRTANRDLIESVLERVERGQPPRFVQAQALGALRFFALGATLTLGSLLAAHGLIGWAHTLGPKSERMFEIVAAALPLIGVGSVLAGLRGARYKGAFVAGLVAALLLGCGFGGGGQSVRADGALWRG